MANDKALDAYIAAQREAHALIDELHILVSKHQDAISPEEVHWGHVGDIRSIIMSLKAILGVE